MSSQLLVDNIPPHLLCYFAHEHPFTQISIILPCSEYEKQTKLNRVQGAAAISSNDYFDRDGAGSSSSMGQGGGGGGDDMDLSAADLVNRLSFQVGKPSLEVVAALTPPTAGFADPAPHHVALLSLCGACSSHPSLHTPLHVCPTPPPSQAKQDLNSMKQLAGSVGQTLTGMASKFMSDIGRSGY